MEKVHGNSIRLKAGVDIKNVHVHGNSKVRGENLVKVACCPNLDCPMRSSGENTSSPAWTGRGKMSWLRTSAKYCDDSSQDENANIGGAIEEVNGLEKVDSPGSEEFGVASSRDTLYAAIWILLPAIKSELSVVMAIACGTAVDCLKVSGETDKENKSVCCSDDGTIGRTKRMMIIEEAWMSTEGWTERMMIIE